MAETQRTLTEHRINPVNDLLDIAVLDGPGPGGASHEYEISTGATGGGGLSLLPLCIRFQNGPISEAGINGVTQEALIAICIDRLRSFQAGQYACRENALALTKLEEARHWLHHRTLSRMARGVEGTRKL